MHYHSMIDVLNNQCKNKPDQAACVFLENLNETSKITFAQLDKDAKKIAGALLHAGAEPGDRAVLIFAPGLDLVRAFWGCLYANQTVVLVQPPFNKKLLEKTHRIIHNCQPKVVLLPAKSADRYADLFTTGGYLSSQEPITVLPFESVFEKIYPWQKPAVNPDDVALLQYTSGSTSDPKGVMVSHKNLLDNLEKIKNAFGMHEHSVMFGWLPPYHDMGLMGSILSPLYTGYTTFLMTPFTFLQNPLIWLQAIAQYRVTITGSPNFAYDYCVKRIKDEKKKGLDLSSWEVAFNGAEPVHHGTMERFYQAFQGYGFRKEAFYPCYGLAELTLLASSGKPLIPYNLLHIKKSQLETHRVEILPQETLDSYRLVSCGSLHHDIRIVDSDTFKSCETDVIGEIWITSDSVAKGYWSQQEETQQIFAATIDNECEKKQYLRTGDLGFIHDNELYVTGRIKDLIILYGKNHYPQDIEATLKHSHLHELLGNCAAFVKSLNNEYLLTLVCELKSQRIEPQELERFSNEIFEMIYNAHTVEIHKIVFVRRNSIPQTTSGKVKRRQCREQLINDELPVIYKWRLTSQ